MRITVNIPLALLADSANVSVEGKLNVVGCFDTIFASSFPAQHHGSVLVFRINTSAVDQAGERSLDLRLVHDTSTVLEGKFPFSVPESHSDLTSTIGVIVQLPTIPLPEPGAYVFQASIEGTEGAYVPFRAVVPPTGQAA
jgi:hypothetical protein